MRRLVRVVFALILICSALAACTQNTARVNGGHNPWTKPGILRLGEPDEPDNLNPMFGHTAATDLAGGLIFSYLLRYDANGNYIPDLAMEVPAMQNGGVSSDGKTIMVHLRKNARWADGTPLTARDWIFTYHAIMNPRNNVKTRYGWDDIASAEAPTPYKIVIHLKQPNASILGILAMGGSAYPPLPEHLLGMLPDINEAPFNEHPLSSGPYMLTMWNHGSSLEFAPNPLYFRGKPKLAKIVWSVVPNATTLFDQLRTHEIDVYPTVDANSIVQLRLLAGDRGTGIMIQQKLIANWRRLMMNTNRPALHDVRVRRAIAEAIDWNRINAAIYHGYDRLAVSDIYPESWAAPNIPRYRFDPADAIRLLSSTGLQLPLQLQISTGTNKLENSQAEVFMQQMLHAVGIEVTIRNYPVSMLFAQDGPLYTGKYDLEWSVDTNAPDPDNSGSWNGKFIPPGGANTAWINDMIINRLSEAAVRTYDEKKRRALYQVEEERIHELVPAVPFYWENGFTALNSDVKNYKPAAFIADSWNSWEWDI